MSLQIRFRVEVLCRRLLPVSESRPKTWPRALPYTEEARAGEVRAEERGVQASDMGGLLLEDTALEVMELAGRAAGVARAAEVQAVVEEEAVVVEEVAAVEAVEGDNTIPPTAI